MSGSAASIGPAERDQHDPRVQRTRAALRTAFNRLFIEHGYGSITPAAIAAAAGVGRSTFYDHYAGKAALLQDTVTAVLRPLAQAAAGSEAPRLSETLQHFWDNRAVARRMLTGRPALIIRTRLADLIEEALRLDGIAGEIPLALIATGSAASALAMIEAWLTGRHACTAEQLAHALSGQGRPAGSARRCS